MTRNLLTAVAGILMAGYAAVQLQTTQDPALAVVAPAGATTTQLAPDNPVVRTTEAIEIRVAVDQTLVTTEDGDGDVLVELVGLENAATSRTPVAFAVVVDSSGSMAGDKIEHARSAASALIERLTPGDVVSLISYDRSATVHIASAEVGSDRSALIRAVEGLRPRGNTCMSCGMERAFELLDRAPSGFVRRVVVLSDGQANSGVTDTSALAAMAARASDTQVVTSTVGLGQDYNELLMTAVATSGTGQYYFLPDAQAVTSILDRELRTLEQTVARAIRVRLIETAAAEVGVGRVTGAERFGEGVEVRLGQLAAGEMRRLVFPVTYDAAALGEVLTGEVTYVGSGGNVVQVAVPVRVERTTDAALAASTRNSDVLVQRELVTSVDTVDIAMNAMRNGDNTAAIDDLTRLADRLERTGRDTDSADLADEAEEVRGLADRLAAPGFSGGGEEGRGLYLQNDARSAEVGSGVPRAQMYHQSAQIH